MNKTKIEWTNYTWNPITGCTKGCPYCYARQIATRFKGGKAFPNGFEPTFHEDRLEEPLIAPKDSKIFTCSMGELFSDDIGKEPVEMVFKTIRYCESKTFQLLTKQAQNLFKWSPFPDNCWIGASVTDAIQLSEAYGGLGQIEAPVKFISYEPLLDNVFMPHQFLEDAGINWVIIGQQTPVRAKTMPNKAWIDDIVSECDKANVPVFLKNNLQNIFDINCQVKLRQEFPK